MSFISQHTIPIPVPAEMCFNFEQVNVIGLFQRLWTQVSVFMRAYINTAIEGSDDFRNAIMPFYGPELADRYNSLFTSFIAKPTNVIEGFLSDDQELVNTSVRNWYSDVNELADLLAGLNPYWGQFQWRGLLSQYVQLKLQMRDPGLPPGFRSYNYDGNLYGEWINCATV